MNKKNTILIPAEAVERSHIQPGEHIAIHVGENTLVVAPEKLTAMQAVNAIALLAEVGSDLVSIVKEACGTCVDQLKEDGCPIEGVDNPDQCPLKAMDGLGVTLTDGVRNAAGIPLDAKLEVFVDEGEVMIAAADYEHDLTDVPPAAREVLSLAGICPARLDYLLMTGEIIHEA